MEDDTFWMMITAFATAASGLGAFSAALASLWAAKSAEKNSRELFYFQLQNDLVAQYHSWCAGVRSDGKWGGLTAQQKNERTRLFWLRIRMIELRNRGKRRRSSREELNNPVDEMLSFCFVADPEEEEVDRKTKRIMKRAAARHTAWKKSSADQGISSTLNDVPLFDNRNFVVR
ncbi:hypothetical protein [Fulvimarina endophytica]|nr:hypothetical protein [Fulvimarina endophytica]